MSEVIYVLTVVFFVYAVWAAEGDGIVAFLQDYCGIDVTATHNKLIALSNRIKTTLGLKWPLHFQLA